MAESSHSLRNPWSDEDRSLGSIRNVLHLAEKTGHLSSKCNPLTSATGHVDMENSETASLMSRGPKSPSLHLIDVLKDIESQRKDIDKTTLEIQCFMQDKETKDITHLSVLDKRIENINRLNTHIQTVVSRKDELIHRLQQPHVGDYLKIDASYKQYASAAIPQLVPILSELTAQLDNIGWATSVDVLSDQMESLLGEISALLANLQSSFRVMLQMHHTVHHLHEQRAQNTGELSSPS